MSVVRARVEGLDPDGDPCSVLGACRQFDLDESRILVLLSVFEKEVFQLEEHGLQRGSRGQLFNCCNGRWSFELGFCVFFPLLGIYNSGRYPILNSPILQLRMEQNELNSDTKRWDRKRFK